jgi:aspartokinase
VETIAVYWENKIKTYGFQIERGLSLFQISTTPRELTDLGLALFDDDNAIRFTWVLAQSSSHQQLKIYLLLNKEWTSSMQSIIKSSRTNGMDLKPRITSPVELVCFHGPHFGDRYGIADTALGTLRKKELPILASGCTGASVYIVVPDQQSTEVKRILSQVFEAPNE